MGQDGFPASFVQGSKRMTFPSAVVNSTKASHQSRRKDVMTFLYDMIYLSLSDEYAFSG
jgi:hypothetical protein